MISYPPGPNNEDSHSNWVIYCIIPFKRCFTSGYVDKKTKSGCLCQEVTCDANIMWQAETVFVKLWHGISVQTQSPQTVLPVHYETLVRVWFQHILSAPPHPHIQCHLFVSFQTGGPLPVKTLNPNMSHSDTWWHKVKKTLCSTVKETDDHWEPEVKPAIDISWLVRNCLTVVAVLLKKFRNS